MKKFSRVLEYIFVFSGVMLIFFGLSSCEREYKGEKLASIEYITTDYNGGARSYTRLDLESGEVMRKNYLPGTSESQEYSLAYSVDPEKRTEIVNALYNSGLLTLKERYTSSLDIIDGGGWDFIITYADGTTKTSSGDNAGPRYKFEKADYAFYNITGEEFFGYVSESYKSPPALHISLEYTDGDNHIGSGLGNIESRKYTWRNRTVEGEWFITETLPVEHGINYTLTARTEQVDEKIKSVAVYSSRDSFADRASIDFELERTKEKTGVVFRIAPNMNYCIIIEFENGTAEYWFNTHIGSSDSPD